MNAEMKMDLSSTTTSPIWICQTNTNPFDPNEPQEWTDYPADISKQIECAYQSGFPEIHFQTGYRIDFKHKLQINSIDSSQQRPIRRECGVNDQAIVTTKSNHDEVSRLEDRLDLPLESDNVIEDTHYQGSRFIMDWLVTVFQSPSNVTFNRIFNLLTEGIQKEGQMHGEPRLREIIERLRQVADDPSTCSDSKRMKILREVCITLYTENTFLYRKINEVLRSNNLTKMETMGPYCFLVYDYIGRKSTDNVSKLHRLCQTLHLKRRNKTIVYRGDTVSSKKLDEYRQAVGNKKKCFKWLCFVSTSTDINVASSFGKNVLYEIDLGRYRWTDQFADISSLSIFQKEDEILLRPGVRFCIDKVERQSTTARELVFIHILPSYISTV
ncbi:unnamed protein product [Rotaria sp. Silwood1]|nr:unnamed protein product [Rotaria sp. Silwood1]